MLNLTTNNTTWTLTLGLFFALLISVITHAQPIPSGPLSEGNLLNANSTSPGTNVQWQTIDGFSSFEFQFVQNGNTLASIPNLPKAGPNQIVRLRVYLSQNEALAAVFYSLQNTNGSSISDDQLFIIQLHSSQHTPIVHSQRFALGQWPNLVHFSQDANVGQGLFLVTYRSSCNISNQQCASLQADFWRLPKSNASRQTSVSGNSTDVSLNVLSNGITIQGTLGGQNFSASAPGGNSGGGSGGGTPTPQPVDPKPVITNIDLTSQIRIYGHANGDLDFTDAQGDIRNLLYVEQGASAAYFSFDPKVQGQTSGNIKFGMFCPQRLRQPNQQANVVVDLFLVDQNGNRSQPGTVRFTCLPAAAPQITNIQVPSSINNGEEKSASFDFADADGDVVRALIQPTNFDPQWLNQFLPGTAFSNPQMAQQLQRKTNGRFGFKVRCPFGVVVGPSNLPTNPTMNLILQDATNQETRAQLSWNCTTNGSAPAINGDSIPSQIGIGRGENSTLSFFDADGDIIGLEVRPLNFPEAHLSKYLQVLDQINRVSFTVGATNGVVNVNAMCQNVITTLGLTLNPEMEIILTDANGLQSQPYNVSWNCVNQQPLALASSAQALHIQPMAGGGLNITTLATDIQSIQLDVFNTAGKRVFSQKEQSGALNYQGLNDDGNFLANGVYFYVITIQKSTGVTERGSIQKMMVLR